MYHAGLISDNLLPLRGHGDEAIAEAERVVEKIVSLVDVNEQLSIWPLIAHEWCSHSRLYSSIVLITRDGVPINKMLMLLPREVKARYEVDLYWDAFTTLKATVEPGNSVPRGMLDLQAVGDCTALLLQSALRSRVGLSQIDFVAQFVPAGIQDLATWSDQYRGEMAASSINGLGLAADAIGIIRDLTYSGLPYIFHGIEMTQQHCPNDQLDGAMQSVQHTPSDEEICIRARRLPKRADFLHPIPLQDRDKVDLSSKLLRPNECTVDKLPFIYSQFALLIPSILHRLEVSLIAEALCENVLPSVEFNDRSLVLTAISTTAARESTNYQRLEFLGDSILKTFTSLTLLVTHLTWHEGILSHQKDHIVSNANLARASLARGLDKYILTIPFTGNKWRPLYVSDLQSASAPSRRELSTKTLADVVESLIGAGQYIIGHTSSSSFIWCYSLRCKQIPQIQLTDHSPK